MKSQIRKSESEQKVVLVIHGGAGAIKKENMTDALEVAYHNKLKEALQVGYDVLINKGSSTDAVQATIIVMEDSPLFNAGKGSVFTNSGTIEMDASIMDGETLNAGAIASVTTIKNPITAAREVMDHSKHVMLVGNGADEFAKMRNLVLASPSYFFTQRKFDAMKRIQWENDTQLDHSSEDDAGNRKMGTVGAVAIDSKGNISAGTSTGGMTNKRFGRAGDTPIIGSGTYANNKTCGVSATGHGEHFIRNVVCYDISAQMEYGNKSFYDASNNIINNKLKKCGGDGGVIGLDAEGNVSMPFNTTGMYRGFITEQGEIETFIYKE